MSSTGLRAGLDAGYCCRCCTFCGLLVFCLLGTRPTKRLNRSGCLFGGQTWVGPRNHYYVGFTLAQPGAKGSLICKARRCGFFHCYCGHLFYLLKRTIWWSVCLICTVDTQGTGLKGPEASGGHLGPSLTATLIFDIYSKDIKE